MKTVAVIEPNKIEIIDIEMPELGSYQALMRTELA